MNGHTVQSEARPNRPAPAALRAAEWVVYCLGGEGRPPQGEQLRELAAVLEQRTLTRGAVAYARGEVPEGVWIVRSGELELAAGSGTQRVVVEVLPAHGITGDIPLLRGLPSMFTARALTDVRAVFLPGAAFAALLEQSPEFTRAWLGGLSARHGRLEETLADSVYGSAQRRVARLLLREARAGKLHHAQATLASMLGLRRPTLNAVLRGFEQRGLLSLGYREITLLSEEKLRSQAMQS
jgi:CRP-like cAMP-binding protein